MPRPRRQVFYSFHFNNDVMRVQQIRNMGVIEGNTPVSPNAWEIARRTPGGIERWINENMRYRSCVVVLVGSHTATRPWVRYEIEKGWNDGKGVVGIYIHNLRDPRTANVSPYYGRCGQGANPFDGFSFRNGATLSSVVRCHNPSSVDAYADIRGHIQGWIDQAIQIRG
jgi:hypothetical protein